MISTQEIKDNYQRVTERIRQATKRSGRPAGSVKLVVVTKTHPVVAIEAAIEAGARCFGENYADEALPKIQALLDKPNLEWHMIGHVQSRKADLVVQHFSYIHSLDSHKLSVRLDRLAGLSGIRLRCLLEYNTSGEESKSGFPAWQQPSWEKLLPDLEAITCLPNLEICGLMTMAPYFEDGESARSYFKRLADLQNFLKKHLPASNWSELSMGMSGDFEVAIEEGATMVRIGTSILGARQRLFKED
jgi:pyridoxal phosphate enzyme (YggS family)